MSSSVNLRTIYAFAREMYPKKVTTNIEYGTAGFRTKADKLDYVMYRMGLLATLRSRVKGGQTIGVMITASHNPEPDNGVKLIDPRGEMLENSWEQLATDLANVSDKDLQSEVEKVIQTHNIDMGSASSVFVGMDNRYHSPGLLKAVSDGVLALKGNVKSFGIVTTPMLHYMVLCSNSCGAYGTPTEEGYYQKLITAFRALRGSECERGNYKNQLLFDGSNGVGARKMLQFLKRMNDELNVTVYNQGEGKINENCGADYVKIGQTLPIGTPDSEPYTRCVSIDGDADRVVYFFTDEKKKFHLLDGDRIATLYAGYLMDLVTKCEIDLKLGIVQTAYANGGSTDYIEKELKVPVACVPTGVKHLHHKALEYDIGVYFEANGHGTIVFSEHTKESVRAVADNSELNEEQIEAAKKLLSTIEVINETVGDAISDMFLVEIILQSNGWDVKDWYNTYTDLPNLQKKICVANRNIITTTDAERKVVTPEGLQNGIDEIVAKYPRGRSFVRPSGTEDIVRVYAEAATNEDVEHLVAEVSQLVYGLAGGIGPELNSTANGLPN
ncbi:phosphoacetylglucosamine mutase [Contarinia nasturtii]|uniref:phosphoacetylglucosamine mutase n=1 Tax=Contarinia nasturtii TaxID=265458 RepID=UPI0012D4411A|nr:phosphoacetylglucosamine mutase [Contarinia nasturtii]